MQPSTHPKNRWNIRLHKTGNQQRRRLVLALTFKHQDQFTCGSLVLCSLPSQAFPFFSNTIVPEPFSNIDAQVSFKLISMKSILKVGGTNLGGSRLTYQAYGNPSIGSMYYIGLTFDQLSQ